MLTIIPSLVEAGFDQSAVKRRGRPLRPCVRCGGTERNAARICVVCAPDLQRAWRRSTEYQGQICEACGTTARRKNGNCIKCQQQYDRNRRIDDPQAERERVRAWQRANPDRVSANNRLRRGRRQGAEGRHTPEQVAAILEMQNGECSYCEQPAEHLDHATPLSRRGSNFPWNLQWLCAFHNTSKGALTDQEYRRKVGLPPGRPLSWLMWMSVIV